jgi:hypothetical protein
MTPRVPATLLWIVLSAPAQQVQIIGDSSRLIAGETLQLTAVVRDREGNLIRNPRVTWTTNPNPATAATIDAHGRLTGRRLGLVIVRAQVAGFGQIESPFQVLPSRFEITPPSAEMAVGDVRQFTAIAYDKDNRPIDGVNYVWSIAGIGSDGPPPNAYVEVSSTGFVRARHEGSAYVRAVFQYTLPDNNGVPLSMATRLMAQSAVRVNGPRDYNLRTLYNSGHSSPGGTGLRYRPSNLIAGPDGSLYFTAALGSTSNALMRWKDGQLTPVLSAGRSATATGSQTLDFGAFSVNVGGDVLAFEITSDGNRVQRGSAGVFQPLLVNNVPAAGVDFIGGFSLSRHSLNRYGQFVFRAGYRDPDNRQFYTGLFRGTGIGVDDLIVRGNEQLPDFPPGQFEIDWSQYGIDDDGTAYFRTRVPGKAVIYRQTGTERTKVIATGEPLLGSTVADFAGPPDGAPAQSFFVLAGGGMTIGVRLADNRSLLLRFPADRSAPPEALAASWNAFAVLDHHPEQGTLVFAPFDNVLKLVLWKSGPASTLLTLGETEVAGTKIESVFSGAFGPNGEIYLLVRGANAKMIGLQLRPDLRVLFQSGDALPDVNPAPVFTGFATAKSGPVQFLTGGAGGFASISEFDGTGLRSVIGAGDVVGRNSIFSGAHWFGYSRTRAGPVYALVPWVGAGRDFGISRLRPGAPPELLYPFNLRIDGIEYWQPYRLAANDQGDLLWQTGTARGDQRVIFTRNGQHRVILTDNGDPAAPTVIDGLRVFGIESLVMDDLGRALAVVRFRERNGNSIIGWDGERWHRLVTTGETEIERRRVTGHGALRAAGSNLMMHLYYDAGTAGVVRWTGLGLEPVVRPAETTPLGYVVNWVGAFDVNSNGDVAYVAGYPDGGQGIFVKRGERTLSVLSTSRPLPGGELLMGVNMLELRDDGLLYVLAPGTLSEMILVEARPR